MQITQSQILTYFTNTRTAHWLHTCWHETVSVSTIFLFIIKSYTEYNKAKAKCKNQTTPCPEKKVPLYF